MKRSLTVAAVASLCLGSIASADVFSADYNVEWDTSFVGEALGATIALPGLASIDSITLDLSHTWAGDLDISLTSPTGEVFTVLQNQGGSADLGFFGTGFLDDVAPYTFIESGSVDFDGTDSLGGGVYNANTWMSGGWDAGDWMLSVNDGFGGDGGAVGTVSIEYTIPAPGALALLGLAGLAGSRRRRV